MERYIHDENIRQFKKLLEEETDEGKRETIRQLLAQEEAERRRHLAKSKDGWRP